MRTCSLSACAAVLTLYAASAGAQTLPGDEVSRLSIGPQHGTFGGPLQPGDSFGFSVAAIGDVNGDTHVDLAIGAPNTFTSGSPLGAVWIALRGPDGSVFAQRKISHGLNGFPAELANNAFFGHAVSALGDVDGDGVPDLAVGNHELLYGTLGSIWIVMLEPSGAVKATQRLTEGVGGLVVPPEWSRIGRSLAGVGDVTGDGVPDLAVGYSALLPTFPFTEGGVAILSLDTDGTVKPGGMTLIDSSSHPALALLPAGFGESLACLGDVDGNGFDDLVVGDASDRAWVLRMGPGSAVVGVSVLHAGSAGLDLGLPDGTSFARSAAGPGDLDGDGVPDLALSSTSDQLNSQPAPTDHGNGVHVITLSAAGAPRTVGFIAAGPGEPLFGSSVAALGDVDDDGVGDLIVGQTYEGYQDAPPLEGALHQVTLNGSTWEDVGGALAGGPFPPTLAGSGTLQPGAPYELILAAAAPVGTPVFLVLGLSELGAAFKGGTLVPAVDSLLEPGPLGATGVVTLAGPWPPGLPVGLSIWAQAWLVDASGPMGFTATNGLRLQMPL